jgi:hypothetical protein
MKSLTGGMVKVCASFTRGANGDIPSIEEGIFNGDIAVDVRRLHCSLAPIPFSCFAS